MPKWIQVKTKNTSEWVASLKSELESRKSNEIQFELLETTVRRIKFALNPLPEEIINALDLILKKPVHNEIVVLSESEEKLLNELWLQTMIAWADDFNKICK